MRQAFTSTLASTPLASLPDGAVRGVTISWGDGSHSGGTLSPSDDLYFITGHHRYQSRRHFKVTITVWQKLHGKRTVLTRLDTTADVTKRVDGIS